MLEVRGVVVDLRETLRLGDAFDVDVLTAKSYA